MAEWTPEFSFDQFTKHEPTIRAAIGANEATTRLRAIDTMLFDVLGWNKTTVETERYCREEGFSDYAFLADGSISLILEAKRHGTSFVLPDISVPRSPVGFSLLSREAPEAEKALRQALGYAASEGARYIGITNGHQWLLTLTYVHNQRLDQRSVYVFESLNAIKDSKFRLFHSCFSPDAINGNRPANQLLESRKAPAPSKLSASIVNYPAPAERNVISNELYVATAVVLEEVKTDEPDPDFLRQCYVVPKTTIAAFQQAKELLTQRLSLDESLRTESCSLDDVASLINSDVPEKPLIILGKVGHGKTTFLRFLRSVRAKEVFDNYIQIDVDFLDRPDSPDQVGQYIYDQVEKELLDNYQTDIIEDRLVRGFLHTDIERFKRSYEGKQFAHDTKEYKQAEQQFIRDILNDRHQYLGRVFAHLKRGRVKNNKGHSVVLFLDNLDRRIDPIQEEAFLRASAMARDWSALVFVCLRPGTFHRSKHFGVLDSVAPRVVAVTSPKTKLLVAKRMEYAKQIALGLADTTRSKKGISFSKDISLQMPSLAPFLEVCGKSFEKNSSLAELFDAVSNGNARDLLSYVHKVITSLHLDTAKIIRKAEAGGYIMPVHEALRAMLYGDSMHYDPEQSVFINLFDITRADPAEHFTRLVLLRHLVQVSQGHPNYGFLPVGEAESYMCQIGYSDEHVRDTLRFLFDKACLEPKLPFDQWSPGIKDIRITDRGSYMVKGLVFQFNYLDAVTVDTPVIDPEYRRQITDVFRILERLDRCEAFLEYLDQCCNALQDALTVTFWKSISDAIKEQIENIRKSV